VREDLAQLLATAQRAWPRIQVAAAEFARYLDERSVGADVAPSIVGDLYLACACAHGDRAALAELDTRFLSSIGIYVARIDATPEFADEVRQELRARLLVASDGKAAPIGEYSGRGPLAAWLRVAAVRTALNLVRSRARAAPRNGEALDGLADSHNPERSLVKAGYRAALEKALAATVADLASDDRTLLRLYYLDGMTIVEIGTLLRIHHSTVARRIERCRATIIDKMRSSLGAELRLDGDELDSVIRLAQSQVDVSLRKLLQTRA
jgi:RNA polymerase sigma-70 factor (ECF subfamily)